MDKSRAARRLPSALCVALYGALLLLSATAFANDAPTVTSYTYDTGDNVATVTDPRGLVTTYAQDGLGQLWQQVSPDSGTTRNAYDNYGRRSSMTPADGMQTTYGYDGLNRVTSISAGGQTQSFTYDSCTNGIGRLCSDGDSTGVTSYSYTPEGWIAGRGFSIGSTTYALGYSHDSMGHVTTVNYPDGNQAHYAYTNGAVSSVTLTVGGATVNAATTITYRPADAAMSQWTSSNGLVNTWNYDTDGRLTSIGVPGVQSLSFGYDLANRITRIANPIDPTMTQTVGYDSMSRVASMTSTANNESYQYDANGNRLTSMANGVSVTYTPDANSNRLLNVVTSGLGSGKYGYDAQGNTTLINGTTGYQYTPFSRLSNSGGATFYINPEGQRLRKAGGSTGTTYFAPDASGALLAEDDNGTWVDYVRLNGHLINRVSGGQVDAIHTDQVGRPDTVTDASQKVIWHARNFPFTSTIALANITLNLGFPGQYYDAETLLSNNGYRDYSAGFGRYIESDPLGLAGGVNTYAYVGNNPLSFVDPYGLNSCSDAAILAEIHAHEAIQPVYPLLAISGIGRLLYAGTAIVIPSIAAATTDTSLGAAAAAVGSRNSLKIAFRLGFFRNSRIYSVGTVLAKYSGNAVEAAAAAGRTNAALNTAAAAAAATGVAAGNGQTTPNGNCGCH